MKLLKGVIIIAAVGALCAPAFASLPAGGAAVTTPPLPAGVATSANLVGLPAGYARVDYVDIGNLASEAGHALAGWGAIFPPPPGYGGEANGRVIWEATGNTASLTMDFGAQAGNKYLALRWLDGIADAGQVPVTSSDSFEFTVTNALGGWVGDSTNTNTEDWYDLVAFNVGAVTGTQTIRLTATSGKWASWAQYGQVAFSEVATYAVPAPGAALLAAIGLSFVGWIKRRIA